VDAGFCHVPHFVCWIDGLAGPSGVLEKQPREIKATQEKKCNARVSLPSYAMQSNNIDDSRKGFKTKG
jgi:hypothetical protein